MSATKSIKGTKTEQNLVNAFAAETQAYCRYTYYAQAADKEQYFPIGEVFRDTAANELHHAKVFLKMLEGAQCPPQAMSMPAIWARPPRTLP